MTPSAGLVPPRALSAQEMYVPPRRGTQKCSLGKYSERIFTGKIFRENIHWENIRREYSLGKKSERIFTGKIFGENVHKENIRR